MFDFSKVLITGGEGSLGSYVDFGDKPNKEVLDITNGESVARYIQKTAPTVVLHMAAATDTKLCEADPEYAYTLNSIGTLNVALAAETVGALLVYVSTSRVFDGEKNTPYTENDRPEPSTVYGKSKYLGEVIASTVTTKHLIVRGCWIFGGGSTKDNKFFGNVIRQLGNEEIAALGDVYGSPTYAKDFIAAIKRLIAEDRQGLVHVANEGSATRAEIVKKVIEMTKSRTNLKIVDREYFNAQGILPTNESVSSDSVRLRPWHEALSEYLATEWGYSVNI